MATVKNIEKLMVKEEFVEYMTRRLSIHFGKGAVVETRRVLKNNGVIYEGITIMERDSNLSPTIYLDDYYDSYVATGNADELFYAFLSAYEKYRVPAGFDISCFQKYKSIRKVLSFRLINYERNKELLQEVPHRRYMDLAVVYMCVLREMELGNASIMVRNEHMEMWGVDEQQLFNQAMENSPQILKPSFKSMTEYLKRMGRIPEDIEDIIDLDEDIDMFILSNECNLYGAAAIMYPGLLKRIAREMECNLILLPSSVHEMIVLPEYMVLGRNHLYEMVRDVNNTALKEEEILSYSVYIYRLDDEMISEYII